MAAKKAPAKKMAAPKPVAKKTSSTQSANAAEKRAMDKKKASKRTDYLGNSGFGQSKEGMMEQAGTAAYKKQTGKTFKGSSILSGEPEIRPTSGGGLKGVSKAQRDYIDAAIFNAFDRAYPGVVKGGRFSGTVRSAQGRAMEKTKKKFK